MSVENNFLLYATLMGVFITFVYDLLRILRRVIPHRDFVVSLEDLIFWGFSGVEVFLLMYHESNGTLRWFAVLGALLGMFLYKKTISGLFVKYTSLLLNKIIIIIGKIFGFLTKPFRILGRKAGNAAARTTQRMNQGKKGAVKYMKNRLTHLWKVLKMVVNKQ